MIVKYKYHVDGTIRLENDLMFEFKGRKYEFEKDKEGTLKSISISVKADADQYAPKITTLASGPVKQQIYMKDDPSYHFIKEESRNLEGIMSLFGMNEINLTCPEISWIAENQEEKDKIHIYNFRKGISEQTIPAEPLPDDFLRRAIVASYDCFDWQIPFTFYRKAYVDYKNGWYLEACYDYFFLLEYLFADGKFKTDEVKKNFRTSVELQAAIKNVFEDHSAMQDIKKVSPKKYGELLEGKSAGDVSDFFVDLRGHIHHQSKKNKKGWHPAHQQEFTFEAELFKYVCFNLMMKTAINLMYGKDVDLKSIKGFRKVAAGKRE